MSDREAVHPAPDLLLAYHTGNLSVADSVEIGLHVADCDSCQRLLEQVTASRITLEPKADEVGQELPSKEELDREADLKVPPDLIEHPRYRILELIGVGGMGTVYKAEHLLMRRIVALKVIKPSLVNRPIMVERFHREVQAAAHLAHPNIVSALDAERAGSTHFLVMEYVKGQNLAEVVAEKGPLPVGLACDITRQVAEGLQHAHERGMVHRDIKPHNLIRMADGRVKVLDFGLTRFALEGDLTSGARPADLADDALPGPPAGMSGLVTEPDIVVGTAEYLAPEQVHSRHADIRSDIYSLGCTLYSFLAGHPPFPNGTIQEKLDAHLHQAPPPLAEERDDLPVGLELVLGKMLAKEPNRRYQTPADVAAALAPFAGVPSPKGWRSRLASAVNWAILIAVLAFLGYRFGPDFYDFVTDEGQLIIEVGDQNVKIAVRQDGKLVQVIDTKTQQTVRLKAGDYQLGLVEDKDRLQVIPNRVRLEWGAREAVYLSNQIRPRFWRPLNRPNWRNFQRDDSPSGWRDPPDNDDDQPDSEYDRGPG